MKYVNYGCGFTAPNEWINFDYSPAVFIRSLPFFGEILKKGLKTTFPKNVKLGNIVKGLPIENESCDGVFSSHTLEHLSLEDLKTALSNTYKMLKVGGIFRCVLPDLEILARNYVTALENGSDTASTDFMRSSWLGLEEMPKTIKKHYFLGYYPGMSRHLWMWDTQSLTRELRNVGFKNIRSCSFNDSRDPMFRLVESEDRFKNTVALECIK